VVDPYLTHAMSEYVVLQVLKLHRQDPDYRAQQQAQLWRDLAQKNAAERHTGFGEIGKEAGRRLKALGFPVSGWSRAERQLAGFTIYAGVDGLARLLAQTEILVCLLPLLQETAGILCTRTFAAFPRGASLINTGRGGHLVEEDLIPARDSGQLSAGALNVLREEPLPAGTSVLASPADHRHAAYRGGYKPRDRRPDRGDCRPRFCPKTRGFREAGICAVGTYQAGFLTTKTNHLVQPGAVPPDPTNLEGKPRGGRSGGGGDSHDQIRKLIGSLMACLPKSAEVTLRGEGSVRGLPRPDRNLRLATRSILKGPDSDRDRRSVEFNS
jgi:D-isomer specific 2-hydroxyacid dehydrogenase, NAD binding domain